MRVLWMSGLVLSALCSISGCDGIQPVTTPTPRAEVITLEPLIAKSFFAQPGESAPLLPAVSVVSSIGNKGLANVFVTFTRYSPTGETAVFTTPTDSHGNARMPAWNIGSELGEYRTVVSTQNAEDVVFRAVVKGTISATYDRVTIDGKPVSPYADPVHYVLFDDGIFYLYNDSYGIPAAPSGTYKKGSDTTISFYFDPKTASPFYQQRDYPAATGRLSGTEMIVTYENTSDFDEETYTLRQ